jgi:uncharacterized oxidoreductase
MKISNNTILITGGSAGIGFELAKALSNKGNHVIIVGRNEQRLKEAAAQLQNTTAIVGDVSDAADVDRLVDVLRRDHPGLNIVINNAGKAFAYDLVAEGANVFEKAGEEMLTNYLSIVRLNERLIPLLFQQREAAIVNVSSIVAFVPGGLATYSASKAALHSYTLSLRHALAQSTAIKVFELMPPLVNTEFSVAIGGRNGIAPSVVAEDLVRGLEQDEYEIRTGNTEKIYRLSLSSPEEAFKALNPVQPKAIAG